MNEQRYVESISTRPATELVVVTGPYGGSSEGVTFTASDERADASVTLTRENIERLYIQLGTWLEATR
ncbi:Uncharacterised protein [Mycobacteroides abscessus]|uniref:hypothetical protein n=1 Tax=Mycobacteroides abscessus TaxID=36809 RepID=UPI0005E7DDC3|nr:hypothetical protein [Mycobacteroides abscessus]CPT93818.1 Uncharacterised protein [Mycobacteroides abscessus]CPW12949.1 Uncharacterised protein [Mycobacteroides abscessus]